MVLALRQGNGLKALKDDVAARWLKAYRDGGKYPKEKLDTFLNLYKKIRSDQMLCFVHSKKFQGSEDHDRSVKKLNELRNEFIHFVPKGWSLDLVGLPDICLRSLEVVNFLGWESGNVTWYEESQGLRAKSALAGAMNRMEVIKSSYMEAVNKAKQEGTP